mgnify:CR=1 FL=1
MLFRSSAVETNASDVKVGLASARLSYSLDPRNRSADIALGDMPFNLSPGQLRLWVKGDGSTNTLQLTLRHAEMEVEGKSRRPVRASSMNLPGVALDFTGWREVTLDATAIPEGRSAALERITISGKQGKAGEGMATQGVIWLDDLRLFPNANAPSIVVLAGVFGPLVRDFDPDIALFLDAQNRVIECEELFRGTLTQTSVYPREVDKAPLARISPRGRIRLGYLSGDFHDHPMAYMFAPLFETHDRGRFETFAFSYGPDDRGPMRSRLRAAFDHFCDLRGKSDRDAAEEIRGRGIDLLVDLAGYTAGNRAAILAHRPAPLQIGFHGFGMGVPFMDYLVSDRQTVPEELQAHFRERIVRLPGCWIATDTSEAVPETTPSRASQGLPESGFVFCSFNAIHKITPTVFDTWMRLLGQVQESVLWVRNDGDIAAANLRREAERRGIDGARLIFAGRVPLGEHLARHRLADLFIDTFPYGAHTTASHALWAGLPVLTMRGDSFVSRVSASIVLAMGFPELVTESPEAYAAAALRLAQNPDELSDLRMRIGRARNTAALFDADRHRRHVEAAYATMYQRWQDGLPTVNFDVTDDATTPRR